MKKDWVIEEINVDDLSEEDRKLLEESYVHEREGKLVSAEQLERELRDSLRRSTK